MSEPLWFQNLAAYSLQLAVVALVGSLLPHLLRLRAPRIMLAYWQALLATCLALPVFQPWKIASVARPLPTTGDVSIQIGTAHVAPGATAWPLATLVLLALGAGTLARLAWMVLGARRLRGYRRRAHLMVKLPETVQQMTRVIPASASFYLSEEISVPATFGRIDPVVLLPRRFLNMKEEFQRAIACHELLHVARSDWTWNLAEEFILALFWFHPAVWWLVSRIRLAREQAVDREVLRLTQAPKPYLHALLEIAQEKTARRATPAPLFLAEGQLAQRVSLMVKEVVMSRTRILALMMAMAVALIFSGCLAVWAFPLRIAPRAPSKVEGGVKGGVPGGVVGGVTGGVTEGVVGGVTEGVEGSVAGGVEGGIDEHSDHLHHVDVKQLKVAHKVTPHYPPLAKQAGVQGKVVLDVTVEKDGSVSDIKVVSGHPLLVKAAMEAVAQWRYEPSPELPATTRVTITFTLADGKSSKDKSAGPSAANQDSPEAQADTKVYKVGGDVKAPKALVDPDPSYTDEARKAKLNGTAVFTIIVNEHGDVTEVKETSKPLGKGLDENAIKTIRRWKFQPALREGKPVAVRMMAKVTFRYF